MANNENDGDRVVYSQEFVTKLREQLLKEYFRLEKQLQITTDNLKNTHGTDNVEETGSEDYLHALDFSMIGSDSEKMRLIHNALEKLERGTYGICDDCGQRISEARLKVRPFARYCIDCKSAREERGGSNGRR